MKRVIIKQNSDIALICGNHINAHTILKNLDCIGFKGKKIVVRLAGTKPGLADRLNKVESWGIDIDNAKDFPELIASSFPAVAQKYVFFTDEHFHLAFHEAKKQNTLANTHFFIGSISHLETILDRFLFINFIKERRLANTPKTIAGNQKPFDTFGDQFVWRPKITCTRLGAYDRVQIIHGHKELIATENKYRSLGLTEKDWCYQELLSIDDTHNVSISGWFGLSEKYLIATRKVLQHPPESGTGDLIEIIQPPNELDKKAEAILSALEYEGPFELEFVFDQTSKEYKVIELNPRFWMQHGLIEAKTGCALVRNYLGLKLQDPEKNEQVQFWINPLVALFRVMKLDFRSVWHLFRNDTVKPVSIFQAASHAPKHVFRKFISQLYRSVI